jgi:alpha-beta hydrolase superfamily lysophospholipase
MRFIATFFQEVTRYFTDQAARHEGVTGLADRLREWQPRILIAHSLGSVVAYEAMWTEPFPKVDLLITLGSPLAMPDIVFDRLADHPGPRQRPPGVGRWINVADLGDIIAIPAKGIGRNFERVAADLSDSIHSFDFHRATNYLASSTATAVLATVV